MKKIIFIVPYLSILLLSGCVPLIVGGAAGALGGYAISRDTIQGDTDKDYDKLWESALTVARRKGTITVEDRNKGYLEVEVDSSRVIVRFVRLTRTATRLKVSARKMGLPNFNLAQDIFVRILEYTS